jgi:hypothetical protein
MQMIRQIKVVSFLGACALSATLALPGLAAAKSLYVLPDLNASPTQLSAYAITGSTLTLQSSGNLPVTYSTVGLGIDTTSKTLFITQEGSGTFTLVSATTLANLGSATAPGASNLAGIVVDQSNNRVYTVDRSTSNLYVYDWNAATKILTPVAGQAPIALPGLVGAYGLALDSTNHVLYVADYNGNRVRGYNTGTWTPFKDFAVAFAPAGIAVDATRGFVYTVVPNGGCSTGSGPTLLSKYNLATDVETTTDMGHGGAGVATDPATGLVYVTGACSGDDLSVWNTTSVPFVQTYSTGPLGNPTGIVVPEIEVSYQTPTIPTLSEWGMITLSSLLALGTIFTLRRKRH